MQNKYISELNSFCFESLFKDGVKEIKSNIKINPFHQISSKRLLFINS